MTMYKVPSFTLEDHKMFFPEWAFPVKPEEDTEARYTESDMLFLMMSMTMGAGIVFDEDYYEFDIEDNDLYLESVITSPAFEHGAATVVIVAGPMVEEAKKNPEKFLTDDI